MPRKYVAGAIGRTAPIGSTPYVSHSASMKATIASVGGRAPPAQKTPRPSAESHWPAGPHVPAPSSGPALRCSDPGIVRRRAQLGAPSDAASPQCTRSYRPPTKSSPTASRADARDRTPVAPLAPGPLVSTSSVFPWTPSSQNMEPLGNPGRFNVVAGCARHRRWRAGKVEAAFFYRLPFIV